jgi:maleylacetoacetate isomerase
MARSDFLLHTYYRSSCSARLRIALNLKQIPVEYAYVHLFKGEQHSSQHWELNPSGSVPVLTHLSDEEAVSFPITQSVAALEYLEEIYPYQVPLLPPPSNPLARAKVRTLVSIVTNDIQPVTNRRIAKALTALGGDPMAWNKDFMTRGLRAYESIVAKTAGEYSVEDSVTMADVCLIPAIWAAEKNDVELEKFPTTMRVYYALSDLQAVQDAHWTRQEDTPEDMAWL